MITLYTIPFHSHTCTFHEDIFIMTTICYYHYYMTQIISILPTRSPLECFYHSNDFDEPGKEITFLMHFNSHIRFEDNFWLELHVQLSYFCPYPKKKSVYNTKSLQPQRLFYIINLYCLNVYMSVFYKNKGF